MHYARSAFKGFQQVLSDIAEFSADDTMDDPTTWAGGDAVNMKDPQETDRKLPRTKLGYSNKQFETRNTHVSSTGHDSPQASTMLSVNEHDADESHFTFVPPPKGHMKTHNRTIKPKALSLKTLHTTSLPQDAEGHERVDIFPEDVLPTRGLGRGLNFTVKRNQEDSFAANALPPASTSHATGAVDASLQEHYHGKFWLQGQQQESTRRYSRERSLRREIQPQPAVCEEAAPPVTGENIASLKISKELIDEDQTSLHEVRTHVPHVSKTHCEHNRPLPSNVLPCSNANCETDIEETILHTPNTSLQSVQAHEKLAQITSGVDKSHFDAGSSHGMIDHVHQAPEGIPTRKAQFLNTLPEAPVEPAQPFVDMKTPQLSEKDESCNPPDTIQQIHPVIHGRVQKRQRKSKGASQAPMPIDAKERAMQLLTWSLQQDLAEKNRKEAEAQDMKNSLDAAEYHKEVLSFDVSSLEQQKAQLQNELRLSRSKLQKFRQTSARLHDMMTSQQKAWQASEGFGQELARQRDSLAVEVKDLRCQIQKACVAAETSRVDLKLIRQKYRRRFTEVVRMVDGLQEEKDALECQLARCEQLLVTETNRVEKLQEDQKILRAQQAHDSEKRSRENKESVLAQIRQLKTDLQGMIIQLSPADQDVSALLQPMFDKLGDSINQNEDSFKSLIVLFTGMQTQ